jgi:hypothetical protein
VRSYHQSEEFKLVEERQALPQKDALETILTSEEENNTEEEESDDA